MSLDNSQPADPRHAQRVRIVQQLYSYSYDPSFVIPVDGHVDHHVQAIIAHVATLDALIRTHAPKYPIEQIAKTDLAILRLALYELTIEKHTPTKVVINEAVELAKEMGSERAYAFVNAVLGAIVSNKDN